MKNSNYLTKIVMYDGGMRTSLVVALRALIIVMLAASITVMVLLLPLYGRMVVETFPEVGHLHLPVLVLTEAFMVSALVVLVSMWVLVGMVGRDVVFSARAFRWVDAIIVAFVVGAVIAFGLLMWIVGFVDIGGPPTGMLGVAGTVGCLAAAVLMALMRGLLVKATEMQDFLAEVV